MKKNKKRILFALVSLLFPAGAMAQYTIYPIPHEQVAGTGTVSFTSDVELICEDGIDAATVSRAEQVLSDHGLKTGSVTSSLHTNIYIGINGSGGAADAKATALGLKRDVFSKQGKYDRHLLALTNAGSGRAEVVVLGETTDAAFYALASLEQMLDGGTSSLPCATLYDYADLKSRGIVEGYYGYPYSVSVKKDLMRFMMRYKMNTYLYGAKSDPYHSNYWQQAYPTTITEEQEKNGWLTQDMVKEIAQESHETKVNFIWAIHPGNNFVGSSSVISDIMGKFQKMYNLGVRQFGVFVDDVSIPSSDADMKTNADRVTGLQQAIEKKWNVAGTAAADTVRPLHFVPQIYCNNFASSTDQYNRFFKALSSTPSYVTIYTTGQGVWSVPNENDLAKPAAQLGRNVAWWWNYPCNDNADGQIYPMDMYSNFYDMPSVVSSCRAPSSLNNGMGVVSNPMQEGEVAKIPLFSVADMAWNVGAFNNSTSWEASFKAALPGNEAAQKAFRYLAPYLRYNDPSELSSLISSYKATKKPAQLVTLMGEIADNCAELLKLKDSEVEGEKLLYNDLSPWLLKLQAMSTAAKGMLENAADGGKGDERWTNYLAQLATVNGLSTEEAYKAYALEGMGNSISVSERPSQPSQLYLEPFVKYMTTNTLGNYFEQTAAPTKPQFMTNVSGVRGNVSGSTTLSVLTSKVVTLQKGQWVGVQLVSPTLLENLSVSDTLVARHSVVFSPDGKQWTRLTAAESKPEDYVRYVAVVNDNDAPAALKLTAKSLRLTIPATPIITAATVPDGEVYDSHAASYMYDGDYSTYTCIKKDIAKDDTYMVTLSKVQPVRRVRLVFNLTNSDYMDEGCVQASADGSTWTTLKVKGSSSTTFTLGHAKAFAYDDNTKYIDFDGEDTEAQYVRLLVTKQTSKKWMRLAEMEVNGDGTFTQPRCEDGLGLSYPQTYDADASTSTAYARKKGASGTLTYYFQNYQLLRGVTLYCDPATLTNMTLAYSRDLNEWTETEATLTSGVVHINFPADAHDMAAVRLTWKGSTPPAVYEVIENVDETEQPAVTSVERVTDGDAAAAALSCTVEAGRVVVKAPAGVAFVEVYALDGRKLLSVQAGGLSEVVLPAVHAAGGPLLVKASLSDGRSGAFKVR